MAFRGMGYTCRSRKCDDGVLGIAIFEMRIFNGQWSHIYEHVGDSYV
jgi:hypothetical protein